MSLRPRYSLLSLLVLTALVAGGVKLWYGPHHEVEQLGPYTVREYTYTCDWTGRKIICGPLVNRMDNQTNYRVVAFTYYRKGEQLKWQYQLIESAEDSYIKYFQLPEPLAGKDIPLTTEEYDEVQNIVRQEKARGLPAGVKRIEYQQADYLLYEQ